MLGKASIEGQVLWTFRDSLAVGWCEVGKHECQHF